MEPAIEKLINYGVLGVFCGLFILLAWKVGRGLVTWFLEEYKKEREEADKMRDERDKEREEALKKIVTQNADRFKQITEGITKMHDINMEQEQKREQDKKQWADAVFKQIEKIADGLAELADIAKTNRKEIGLQQEEIKLIRQSLEAHSKEIERLYKLLEEVGYDVNEIKRETGTKGNNDGRPVRGS